MNEATITLFVATIGAVSGLLPVAVRLIANWVERRTLASRQKQVIERAHKRLEFLNLWIQTQQLICSDKDVTRLSKEVARELTVLRNEISVSIAIEEKAIATREDEFRIESRQKRPWSQLAFLAYLPKSPAGWVFHLLFYMALGACVLLTAWVIYGSFVYGNPGSTPLAWIWLAYGPLALTFVFTYVCFWTPARFIDKRHRTKLLADQSSSGTSAETNTA